MGFDFISTGIEGLYVVETAVYKDNRGYFKETYNEREFNNHGLDMVFVQDNHSMSVKGVLRGLHYQKKHPQGKLVRAIKGEIYDVAVDIRHGSSTFGEWFGTILSEENNRQLYIPEGFCHGFLVLSDVAEFAYKCSDFYYPKDESGIMWDDPDLDIDWPIESVDQVILSAKDTNWDNIKDLR